MQELPAWPAAGSQREFAFRDRDAAAQRVWLPVVRRADRSRRGVAHPERFRYARQARMVALEGQQDALEAERVVGFPELGAEAEFPEAPMGSQDRRGTERADRTEPVRGELAPSAMGARAAVLPAEALVLVPPDAEASPRPEEELAVRVAQRVLGAAPRAVPPPEAPIGKLSAVAEEFSDRLPAADESECAAPDAPSLLRWEQRPKTEERPGLPAQSQELP